MKAAFEDKFFSFSMGSVEVSFLLSKLTELEKLSLLEKVYVARTFKWLAFVLGNWFVLIALFIFEVNPMLWFWIYIPSLLICAVVFVALQIYSELKTRDAILRSDYYMKQYKSLPPL